jgi:ABC-type nickel/cobalt efflux system permease component RcnA
MFGLDEWIASHAGGGALALLVAVLLGLRHATDPDHLTAVSTLVLADQRQRTSRASRLGLAWGLGHAVTLFSFGLPVILFRRLLPPAVEVAAEFTVGVVIVGLALRLLLRWRRGTFHTHAHAHAGATHAHPHLHEIAGDAAAQHRTQHATLHAHHTHGESLGRSPLTAFGVGLLHGAGGSAAVGVLLVSAVSGGARGVLALLLFAAATAASMAFVSSAFGYALARGAVTARLERLVPVFGVGGVLFGVWYALAALGWPAL